MIFLYTFCENIKCQADEDKLSERIVLSGMLSVKINSITFCYRDVNVILSEKQISWGRVSRRQLYLSGKQLKGMGSRNVTPSIGTPIHNLHSKFANTDLRCNLLYLDIEEVKGVG